MRIAVSGAASTSRRDVEVAAARHVKAQRLAAQRARPSPIVTPGGVSGCGAAVRGRAGPRGQDLRGLAARSPDRSPSGSPRGATACDASPYACRRSRIAMRGSRDVSLCSLVMRPSAVSSGRRRLRRVRLVVERARRGEDQLIVGARQRVDARRRPLRAASGRSAPTAPLRGRCRSASAPSASSSSIDAEHAGGARGIHPHLPGRMLRRTAAAACAAASG